MRSTIASWQTGQKNSPLFITHSFSVGFHAPRTCPPAPWYTPMPGTPAWIQCAHGTPFGRSEEHTSELQSHSDLVCRLLLEKKNVEKSCPASKTASKHSQTP